jgi:hypothetical protein
MTAAKHCTPFRGALPAIGKKRAKRYLTSLKAGNIRALCDWE